MSFTLLILAGGLGSRFNGSKQIEGMDRMEIVIGIFCYDAFGKDVKLSFYQIRDNSKAAIKVELSYE